MLPETFLDRMQKMLGKEEYEEFLRSFEQDRYQALRRNPWKNPEGRSLPFKLTPVSWEEEGFYYPGDEQPGKHPYHEAGVYYIQEPSAMAVVPLLEVKPGEKVLDLCAAPGGKSTQIGARLRGEGILVSNEIHPARAKILSENIERMGIVNACVTNEEPMKMADKFPGYFDKILVDAPCSGEGMFRKNEAACEEWSLQNVELCAARQDQILDCAAKMLRPGGRMVYSTCTFAPAENEGSISRFLKRHPDFVLRPIDKGRLGLPDGLCDGRQDWACGDDAPDLTGTLRLWPHRIKGEGHFAAVLEKAGEVPEGYESYAAGGIEKGISRNEKELEAWREFQADTLTEDIEKEGKLLRFGDQLYRIPGKMPSLKGLKVLRPGLHLGTLKKNRFEPSHALALALTPEKVRHACHFSAENPLLASYLSGQTYAYEEDGGDGKGWYLIAVDGCSIGWGKLAGGIMKNHYPKGLRKG